MENTRKQFLKQLFISATAVPVLGFSDTTDTFILKLNDDISICNYSEES